MPESRNDLSQIHPAILKVVNALGGEGFISKPIERFLTQHDQLIESILHSQHSKLVASITEWSKTRGIKTTINFIKNKVNGEKKEHQPKLSELLENQTEENNVVVLCGGIFNPGDVVQYLPPAIAANKYFRNILLGLKDKHNITNSSLTIVRHANIQDAVDALLSKANVIVFAGHGDWTTWFAAGRQFFTDKDVENLNLPPEKRNKIIVRNTCAMSTDGQQLGTSASDNGGKIYGWDGRGTWPREMIADPLHEN